MKTDMTVLLDRSGSMQSIKDDTIGGFNEFLKTTQKEQPEATISLVQFDSQGYDRVIDAKPLTQAEPMTDATFQPRGGTPLIDAMARTILETGVRLATMTDAERPGKVIFVIITDGLENASKEYTREQVMKMVEHQRDVYKWDFIYLGANQDAIAEAATIGIPMAAAASYTGNNTRAVYATVGGMANWVGQGKGKPVFSAQARASLVKPTPKGKPVPKARA
jgi:uncharacterized protein YegL